MNKTLTPIALLSLLTLLTGCQGSPTEPGGSGLLTDKQLENEMFFLLNGARSDQGLAAVELDQALSSVARSHSRAMRDQNFFGHLAPDGSTAAERVLRAGISFSQVAENVVRVDDSLDPAGEAHHQLMLSYSHRQNILGSEWVVVGLGAARGNGSVYFTQLFVRL